MEFVYDAADRLIESTYPQLGGAAVGMIATQRFNAGTLLETVSLQAAGGGAVSDVVAAIHWGRPWPAHPTELRQRPADAVVLP